MSLLRVSKIIKYLNNLIKITNSEKLKTKNDGIFMLK